MEIIPIERKTFEELLSYIESVVDRFNSLCDRLDDKSMSQWLDGKDVCNILNIQPRTLQTYRDEGKIGFSQINHKIFYKPCDVEKVLNAGKMNKNSRK
ncbi:hypothetical protein M2451_002750 [Dysgonomonas sp. PFB1-18]|uniref:helix-turn-helix domain-containing protein n=1 Tax=unclassified Dysgonomonas TaxID=2630389 RepID=UPI002474E625|nr:MULTISPECIES: helix-turn-helix domain-containing protein [unclassified Dysgonomonas]MDH6309364.1 hypothetical protein [Dysgonomonas sp. PF1-14]MDH6339771.1 hypothetical protein [Dysgonomonas sp. PF1-16]MDH6381419.1 hypothetical protein [Dysgonomonas sp. PFB1-18]MDH6398634.1 hypothetical protein [Dysgonomonas sp. PF1-23]